MESRTRAAAREIINGLKNAEDTQTTVKWLHAVNCLITRNDRTSLPKALENYEDVPFTQLCSVFRERHFASVCSTILDLLTVEWLQGLPSNCFSENVEMLFLAGPASDSLMMLIRAVQNNRQGFKMQKITTLLEMFINKGRMVQVIWDQCQVCDTAEGQHRRTAMSSHGGLWEELVTALASLPSQMANRLGRETGDVFLPQNYVPHLANCILQCLQRAHDLLVDSKACSLDFVSRLVGKLCFTGSADHLLDVLVPVLCSSVTVDSTWSQVSERLFMGVPLLTMESVVVPLLTKVPWYKWVEKLVGDCVVSSQRVQFLMCTKLLFHRYFSQELLLQNLIGYLAGSSPRRALYKEVFGKLLQVWGDASNLKHVSSEQHLFLCRALMVCISHLGPQETEQWKRELIQLLLPGVQGHLGSSDVSIRSRGMLVAKVLTKTLDPAGQQIEFEIPRTVEVEGLERLLVVPPDPGMASIQQAVDDLQLSDPQPEGPPSQPSPDDAEELDSDDDLVPYDMSFDKKQSKVKAPKYIRDCMEGLLNVQEADTFEASLQAAETLIWGRPDGLAEIAAEFSKILLHTTESCGTQDFVSLRFQAMVALAVQCPKQVAPFLTRQFYERNYNIRQRLDILEVLTAAAQKLSQPYQPSSKKGGKRTAHHNEEARLLDARPETWREVVQRRIESKTRRFGKGRTQPEPVATANRFGAVAGEFFYPLMALCDRREGYFDLLGEDSLVLNRLVYSLAIVLHAAVHTTAARQMGKTLLEFTWSLRVHPDVKVREAVLVATSIILLVLPSHFLLTDLQVDLMETKAWLEGTVEKEVNEDCRELAVQGLRLLEATIAKEMQDAVANT
ncbi:telomere length regulation protein TEL2 homolog isoform X2 [Babylonia areolata]|uniref:telomere length regulation protein TEL2 homolog isoform X2 n=1 Tax=Babylonia areolata TaxID=304850 RepID=UPI003FCFCC77